MLVHGMRSSFLRWSKGETEEEHITNLPHFAFQTFYSLVTFFSVHSISFEKQKVENLFSKPHQIERGCWALKAAFCLNSQASKMLKRCQDAELRSHFVEIPPREENSEFPSYQDENSSTRSQHATHKERFPRKTWNFLPLSSVYKDAFYAFAWEQCSESPFHSSFQELMCLMAI